MVSRRKDLNNSESLCHSDVSHQISAQSNLWFGISFEEFQDPPSWISEQNNFSVSKPLCHSDASRQALAQSDLRFGRRCRLKIPRWPPWRPSWISEWNDFSNSESL